MKKILCIFLMAIFLSTVLFITEDKIINAQTEIEEKILEEYFTVEELEQEMFSIDLLAQISISDLEQIRETFFEDYGEFEEVENVGPYEFEVYLEEGILETTFALNEDNEIISLLFTAATDRVTELDELIAEFEALKGSVSLLASKNGEILAEINSDKRLSVASTFKIAVFAALKENIEESKLEWQETAYLQEKHRSIPSGILQDWPENSSFTLESLAGKMISLSDNTATDILIDYMGREKINEFASHKEPFLTTREMFTLKAPDNADLLEQYREASIEERYKILDDKLVDKKLPSGIEYIHQEVRAVDIGWYFSVKELKSLMRKVYDQEIMQINPGIINDKHWEKVAYKGGSDLGVLNYSTYMEDENRNKYFISATWNQDDRIDERKFQRLYRNLSNILQYKY